MLELRNATSVETKKHASHAVKKLAAHTIVHHEEEYEPKAESAGKLLKI